MASHLGAAEMAQDRVLRQIGVTAEDLRLLRARPPFRSIAGEQIVRLLAAANVRRYERGTILFTQGEPATRFFVVLEGWIRLYRETPDGQHSTIGVFGKGESVAEAAVLAPSRYPVSCNVVSQARLLAVPGKEFLDHLRQNPDLAIALLASMYVHLRGLVQQVEQLTSRSSVQRLADFLLRLCGTAEQRAEVELPLDKVLIAARLGMQPETLSRSLAKLRQSGVETQGHRILIEDVGRLRRLAGQK